MTGNPPKMKVFFIWAVILILIVALFSRFETFQFTDKGRVLSSENQSGEKPSRDQVPDYVYEVLNYVIKNNAPMPGYIGGRTFYNREKLLPLVQETGTPIQYKEWDVHPKKYKKNRGSERLVTSSSKTYYYTKDHYQSFQKIEP